MDTLDYKKQMKELYFPPNTQPVLIDVPEMQFVMADGHGDPNTSALFQDAMQALYGLSYTIKFMLKTENTQDYVVFPLEGLWWMEDMREFSLDRKDEWLWTVMIRQPEWVNQTHFKKAIEEIKRKKQAKKEPVPESLSRVRFERFKEGLSTQIMHIGPFAAEAPTIAKLHSYITEQGFKLRDKHHEIYMSDPRRTPQEKLKTVIRQPVSRVD
jgi:hypothetical protein